MTDVGEKLTRELQDALAARFDSPLAGAADSGTRLLFAALGRPVDPSQFALPSNAATLEATSGFVDCLPAPGMTFVPRIETFSDAYENLLMVARPLGGLPEDVSETIDAQLAAARRRLDNSRIQRFNAPIPYVPTQQDPVRWFDPAGTHWTSLSVSEEQSSGQTQNDPSPVPDLRPPPWDFRLPDRVASLDRWMLELPVSDSVELADPDRVLLNTGDLRLLAVDVPPEVVAPILELRARAVDPVAPHSEAAVLRHLDRGDRGVPALAEPVLREGGHPVHRHLLEGLRVLGRPEVLRELVEESSPVPTTSSSFSLELDYCLVSLQRRWLQTAWLESDEWHVPGFDPGEVSAGDPMIPDQQLAAFPVAFVAVKDVVVRARWTEQDSANLPKAAGLGPFGMAGGGFSAEAGALVIPGVQIIAWFCQVPPKLPPDRPSP